MYFKGNLVFSPLISTAKVVLLLAPSKGLTDTKSWTSTKFKSSQVFSSAGYELASDNSQFTRTFANTLRNNPNYCLPIESIVSNPFTVTCGSDVNNRC